MEFRNGAMRAAFLIEDRPELQFASEKMTRDTQTPMMVSRERLKHLARCLMGHRRVVQKMHNQAPRIVVSGYTDSVHWSKLRTIPTRYEVGHEVPTGRSDLARNLNA